jgi:hypothetical protein
MFKQTVLQLCFDFFARLPIVVEPKEVDVSSDAGLLPIRQFDSQIGFTDRFIECLEDPRDPDLTRHTLGQMARQRLYGIIAGYEDCNDHDTLNGDPVFKIVSGREPNQGPLASQPTLSRFENDVTIDSLFSLRRFLIDDFVTSFEKPPAWLTLDLDATDDPCHGGQQLALFHGFYDQYQYLPLIISCDQTKQILWASLRPGSVHAASAADDALEQVVARLRQAWPDVVIEVRGDAGFGVPWMYEVSERLELLYTFGLSSNEVLKKATQGLLDKAVETFEQTGELVRLFDQLNYQAKSWKNPRRVIAKVEVNQLGINRRFIVTNRPAAAVLPEGCYDNYVQRGESENRHKELKNGFCGDRLSCHRFVANAFRLQLHVAALNLLVRLRGLVSDPPTLTHMGDHDPDRVPVQEPTLPVEALDGQERRRYHNRRRQKDPLGQGHIETWRTLLIKVAGEVTQSTRRIRITIPAQWPHLSWFLHVCQRIREFGRLPRPDS